MNDYNDQDVSIAFSSQSPIFDAIDNANSLISWVRNRVRTEVLSHMDAHSRILELNCGTGIDTIFFARHGHSVVATDNADGMLNQLKQKLIAQKLQDNVEAVKCSFNNIKGLGMGQFDYVFSNFGGLNCTDKLYEVIEGIDTVLKPGGYFSLVVMPKVCPWEILMLLKGDAKTAFRRFKKNGTNARVEGHNFLCYYYPPEYIIKHAGSQYKTVALKGLSIIVPPPFIENFIEKHPKLFRGLEYLEDRVWNKFPFNRWCDHYIITMQKTK